MVARNGGVGDALFLAGGGATELSGKRVISLAFGTEHFPASINDPED
jgi:hypothetical protein